jgi:short-subunit dehydrogenase
VELKKKTVVITGGSHGLGKALAKILRAKDANVIVSSSSGEKLEAAAKQTGSIPIIADVRDERQVIRLADQAVNAFGKIDVWINCAGIWIPRRSIEETDWAEAHNMFEINFFGLVYGSKAALTSMKKNKSGIIINILSTSALDSRKGLPAYQASKYAAKGFTGSLREEAKEFGINVIAVYPGGMKTLSDDEEKPSDYSTYLDPENVAQKIIDNLVNDNPEEEQIIRRQI